MQFMPWSLSWISSDFPFGLNQTKPCPPLVTDLAYLPIGSLRRTLRALGFSRWSAFPPSHTLPVLLASSSCTQSCCCCRHSRNLHHRHLAWAEPFCQTSSMARLASPLHMRMAHGPAWCVRTRLRSALGTLARSFWGDCSAFYHPRQGGGSSI
jgi:hypothetical protein